MNKYLASILENVYLLGEYEQLRILMMLLEKQGLRNPKNLRCTSPYQNGYQLIQTFQGN